MTALRRETGDRTHRRIAMLGTGVLACLVVLTVGFAVTVFRWCYLSAAPSLGLVPPDAPHGIDAMICLSTHIVEITNGWILIVAAFVAATGLIALGVFQKSAVRRAVSFAGSAAAVLFAVADGGLMLFGVSWCQSQRLF